MCLNVRCTSRFYIAIVLLMPNHKEQKQNKKLVISVSVLVSGALMMLLERNRTYAPARLSISFSV